MAYRRRRRVRGRFRRGGMLRRGRYGRMRRRRGRSRRLRGYSVSRGGVRL